MRLEPVVLAFALTALGGCRVATEIDLTLTADTSLSDPALASARHLAISASGDDTFSTVVALDKGLQRTETLVYRARADHGQVALTLSVTDGSGAIIACAGPTAIALAPHGAVSQMLTLSACSALPGDMGTVDLAASDAGVDLAVPTDLPPYDPDSGLGGPSKCGGAGGALLCEGWEENPIPATWNLGNQNGLGPERDTTRSARGAASLHLALLPGGGGYTSSEADRSLAFPSGPSYARAFVYLTSPLAAQNAIVFGLRNGYDTSDSIDIALFAPGGYLHAGNNTSSTRLSPDRWYCVELMYDSTNGDVKVWLDDQPIGDLDQTHLSINGADLGAAPDQLMIIYDQPVAPSYRSDLWLDEVMVSTSRVGCTR